MTDKELVERRKQETEEEIQKELESLRNAENIEVLRQIMNRLVNVAVVERNKTNNLEQYLKDKKYWEPILTKPNLTIGSFAAIYRGGGDTAVTVYYAYDNVTIEYDNASEYTATHNYISFISNGFKYEFRYHEKACMHVLHRITQV